MTTNLQNDGKDKLTKKQRIIRDLKRWAAIYPFCLMGALFISHSQRVWIEEVDQSGTLDCVELKNATATGTSDYVSYYVPELFHFGDEYETVAHYQWAEKYKFKQCQADIEEERAVWCKDAVESLSGRANLHFDRIVMSDEVHALCAPELNERFGKFHGKPFEVLVGIDGAAIKHGDAWVSLREVRIGTPTEVRVHHQTQLNLGKLCIEGGNGYSICGMFGSVEEARQEQERLLGLAYGLSAFRTTNSVNAAKEGGDK